MTQTLSFLATLAVAALPGRAGDPSPAPEASAAAKTSATGTALTFDESLGIALRSPSIEGDTRALAVRREGNERIGALTSNPLLVVQPGVAPRAGGGAPEIQAGLSQSFNLAGHGSARRAAARAELDQLDAEARAAILARRLDAARAWIDLWAAERALALAQEELALATDIAGRTRRAADAAALTRSDAAEADTYRAEARLAALSIGGEVTDLGLALARLSSRAPEVPLSTAGDLPAPSLPPAGQWPALARAAGALPATRALRLAAEADRARSLEVRASRGAELSLGVLFQRDAAGSTLFANVGASLPLFERGAREAAAFDADAARRAGHAEDAARAAVAELARAFHEVEHAGEILDELQRVLLPAALESARLRQAAFQAGDATVLEVLVARRAAAQARAREARARAARAWAGVKVAFLVAQLGAPSAVERKSP